MSLVGLCARFDAWHAVILTPFKTTRKRRWLYFGHLLTCGGVAPSDSPTFTIRNQVRKGARRRSLDSYLACIGAFTACCPRSGCCLWTAANVDSRASCTV